MKKILNLILLSAPAFPLSVYADTVGKSDESENTGQEILDTYWDKGGSHVDKTECAFQELEKLEKELEKVYNEKISDSRRSDRMMREAGITYAEAEKTLAKSQKNFKLYMESDCDRRMSYMGAGSYGGDVNISCKIDFIRERIKSLKKISLP